MRSIPGLPQRGTRSVPSPGSWILRSPAARNAQRSEHGAVDVPLQPRPEGRLLTSWAFFGIFFKFVPSKSRKPSAFPACYRTFGRFTTVFQNLFPFFI